MLRTIILVIVILFSGCKNNTLQPDSIVASGNLSILTDSSSYNLVNSNDHWSKVINATLLNRTNNTFYAKLGDGYDVSLDQDQLFIAQYSDGFIEECEGNSWVEKERGILIEGVRTIAIRPSKSYTLSTFLRWTQPESGIFRLRIQYYQFPDSVLVGTPLTDYSNSFTIKSL